MRHWLRLFGCPGPLDNHSERSQGNHRRYRRAVLRRLAVIKVAQRVGIPLSEIGRTLVSLPKGRTPTAKDRAKISARWRTELHGRINRLIRFRDELSNCIGCGCLSLESCPLYNPGDELGTRGRGPRLLYPT